MDFTIGGASTHISCCLRMCNRMHLLDVLPNQAPAPNLFAHTCKCFAVSLNCIKNLVGPVSMFFVRVRFEPRFEICSKHASDVKCRMVVNGRIPYEPHKHLDSRFATPPPPRTAHDVCQAWFIPFCITGISFFSRPSTLHKCFHLPPPHSPVSPRHVPLTLRPASQCTSHTHTHPPVCGISLEPCCTDAVLYVTADVEVGTLVTSSQAR
jgi:hypothetical protein